MSPQYKRKVVKQIRWSMGHRLVKNYPHKCKNAHGHEYLAEIEVATNELDQYDFVIDFSIIKEKIKTWIDEFLDHGFLCSDQDKLMIEFLAKTNQKYYIIDSNPTAEAIALMILDRAKIMISNDKVEVTKVTVWETPDSYAIAQG